MEHALSFELLGWNHCYALHTIEPIPTDLGKKDELHTVGPVPSHLRKGGNR